MDFRRAKWVAWTGLALALVLAAIARRPAAHAPSGKEGEVVAEFSLPRVTAAGLQTSQVDGPQLHRDKPLLLHFWAPSCGPCREELPLWQVMAQRAGGYTVLTVAGDEAEEVAAYLVDHHLTLPVVWDGTGAAHKLLGVWGIPHTFAVTGQGVIVRDLEGPQSEDSLAEALAAAHK